MKSSLRRSNEEITQIFNRHVDTVYRVCFMYMKNKHDTEDLVQNTFIKLMNDGTVFESQEHEKAWLIRTATNLCKDHFRHWWSKTVGMDKIPEDAVEYSFDTDGTYEMIMSLPPKYKTVIYLYYYEGYSTAEIAKMLNKNHSTIRSHLHNARKLLKIKMEDELYEK
ncbi:MAG: RNA polymerase sigma factor [Eubacteriales bacterium]|jgi:RNA polymerase sigma factor (sigma-70 family)|nr:RNA polymerase sigma factor [Clostridiales bacterium]